MTAAIAYAIEPQLESLVADIENQGYAISDGLVPLDIIDGLMRVDDELDEDAFDQAGIGREQDHMINGFVRRDEIHWLRGTLPETKQYLDWAESFRLDLNRQLFLGLFDYECHFARYQPGAFYKKHLDAFQGQTNRVLSTVTYLNPDWTEADGGQLVIYTPDGQHELERIVPVAGRFVTFLSNVYPHEVLPAQRTRRSIAGWFRVNGTTSEHLDPAR